ncbi:MAG: hypothetical protein F4Y44_10530 [Chloroflexi bacterium]|nr:hypothetical protein [Chloroflexota bacterium]
MSILDRYGMIRVSCINIDRKILPQDTDLPTDRLIGFAPLVTATDTFDYEARSHYLLNLHVSDGKGITGYDDPATDNTVRVKVNITDAEEADVGSGPAGLKLIPSATRLKVGETVNIRAVLGDLPKGAANPSLRWIVEDPRHHSRSFRIQSGLLLCLHLRHAGNSGLQCRGSLPRQRFPLQHPRYGEC